MLGGYQLRHMDRLNSLVSNVFDVISVAPNSFQVVQEVYYWTCEPITLTDNLITAGVLNKNPPLDMRWGGDLAIDLLICTA